MIGLLTTHQSHTRELYLTVPIGLIVNTRYYTHEVNVRCRVTGRGDRKKWKERATGYHSIYFFFMLCGGREERKCKV